MPEQREHEPYGPFWKWLETLPDLCARATVNRGRPIELPDPKTEHGRKLYESLGVKVKP